MEAYNSRGNMCKFHDFVLGHGHGKMPIQYLFRIDIFAVYLMFINIDVASIWLIINELDDRSEFEQYEYQIIE